MVNIKEAWSSSSFHDGMAAQIKLNGTLLEPISVDNGLRQGCCMAPVLFNLYTCFVRNAGEQEYRILV